MKESINYEVFKTLIRRSSKVLFSFDVESVSFSFLNNSFSQIWRRTRESVMANPILVWESVHPDDKEYIRKEYKELLSGIIKHDIEFRVMLPDNSVAWLLMNPQLVTDEKGRNFIAGIIDDVTEQKDNHRNLERFAAKKNSALEIISHDLAGPLANIQILADILAEDTKKYQNDELSNVIRIIRESCARSIHLIRDLVTQEFLESSNAGFIKKRVDLVEEIKEIIEQYKESKDHVQKEFIFETTSDKFFVYIDDNKFMQVINNLISNAIKFTHDNGIISINLSEHENFMLIEVSDNGIGIPKRFHDGLFERFTKARRVGLRGEPSTGLGMSIIKTIIEWHNGRIWFESEENVGTTFYIELPKE